VLDLHKIYYFMLVDDLTNIALATPQIQIIHQASCHTFIPLKFPTAFWLSANRLFTAPSEIRASLNEFCVVEQYDKLVGRNFVEIKHRGAFEHEKSLGWRTINLGAQS